MAAELSLERVEKALRHLSPDGPERPGDGERAAVAMVLRYQGSEPRVLLMTRAARAGDRWSGQVSLPGGRAEDTDESLLATAVRETREEVGLDLGRRGRLLGRLPPLQARARGEPLAMTINPFVFHCAETPTLHLGAEAVETFWFPLAPAANGAYASTFERAEGDSVRAFPCWRFGTRVIWGLTFEMLRGFLRLAAGEGDSPS